MEQYWFGLCVGWLMGAGLAWCLYRDLVKHLKKQVAALEDHIRKFT